MFSRLLVLIFFIFNLVACNQRGKYYATDQKDTSRSISYKDDDSTSHHTTPIESGFNEHELQLFCNSEIAPYCVLLPLNDLKEDAGELPAAKARHKFLLKKDTTHFTSIELQAFTIDKKNYYNTQLFYKRDRNDIEESGLGIDTAYMDDADYRYVIKGYLPNYQNMKYVQVNWILEDRIAVYFNYDVKDEALWNDRIAAIIKRGVAYSDQ